MAGSELAALKEVDGDYKRVSLQEGIIEAISDTKDDDLNSKPDDPEYVDFLKKFKQLDGKFFFILAENGKAPVVWEYETEGCDNRSADGLNPTRFSEESYDDDDSKYIAFIKKLRKADGSYSYSVAEKGKPRAVWEYERDDCNGPSNGIKPQGHSMVSLSKVKEEPQEEIVPEDKEKRKRKRGSAVAKYKRPTEHVRRRRRFPQKNSNFCRNHEMETESDDIDECYASFLKYHFELEPQEDGLAEFPAPETKIKAEPVNDSHIDRSRFSPDIKKKQVAPSGSSIKKENVERSWKCIDNDIGRDGPQFREKLMEILSMPYDAEEHKALNEKITERKAVERHRETRGGTYKYFGGLGKSYLDHHPDLRSRLQEAEQDKQRALMFLRGFFFWLKNVAHKSAFIPWKDSRCMKVLLPKQRR